MDLRQIAWRWAPCGLLVLAVGCTDPMLGLERSSTDSTLSLATQPAARPWPAKAPARSSKPRGAAVAPASAPVGDTFTLYLVRNPAEVATGPYAKAVAVHRADNLRGERQAVVVKATGADTRRLLREVERVGERRPVEKLLDRRIPFV